jgi:flagellar basal body-associated protein FliL
MKKFIASLILVGMLSGCTYTAYTVQKDDQPKSEVKHVESKDNYYSIKDKRAIN